jgi:hypothetical protein
MLRSLPFRAGRTALALAVVALSACGDHPNPAETSPDLRPQHSLSGGGGGDVLPALSSLSLSTTALVIGGAPVSYTATVDDPINGWSLRGDIIQGSTQISVGAATVPCGAPSPSCTVSSAIAATSALVPGTATFRLQLLNKFGAVMGAKSVTVTLAPRPTIDAVNLSSLHILLDGPATPYTVTLHNGGPALSGVSLASWLSQDGVATHTSGGRRAGGAGPIQCGSGPGILPTGPCTISMALVASNSNAGTGLLVPGLTQVELDLTQSGVVMATGPSLSIHIDSATVVTGSGLSLSSSLSSTTPTDVTLEGPSVPYTITLQNTGSARSGISIRTSVAQNTASRDAGSTLVSCGSGSGVLPNGTCTFSFQITATNTSAGSGTLLPGASASLVLNVVDANGTVLTQVTVVAPLNLLQSEGPPPPPSANVVPVDGVKMSRIKP